MVLSRKKMKRKRAEEEATAGTAEDQNLGNADDSSKKDKKERKKRTKEIVTEEPVLQSADDSSKKDKERKKRTKESVTEEPVFQSADASHDDDGGVEIEMPTGGENAAKNKKKKEKKRRNREANDVAPAGDEDRLSNGKLNGAVDHSGADYEPTPSNAGRAETGENENGVSANGVPPNGVQKIGNGNDKGMTVRERKGKKKKDRWGGVVQEAEEQQWQEPADAAGNPEGGNEAETTFGEADDSSGGQRYEPKKVYVGGMPYYVTEENIIEFFSDSGKVTELDCVLFPDTGKFRGLAFITFETVEGARKALELDGSEMGGRFLKITKCLIKPPKGNKTSAELGEVQKHEGCLSAYIGNLSWNITEDVLKNFLKKHFKQTKIEAIRFAYDKDSGDFRGYGHIDFGDDDSLEAAVRLNQTQLLGRPVKIAYSVPKRTVERAPPTKPNGGEEARDGCFNCGRSGHKAFMCPDK